MNTAEATRKFVQYRLAVRDPFLTGLDLNVRMAVSTVPPSDIKFSFATGSFQYWA